jgi:hypothetical protein
MPAVKNVPVKVRMKPSAIWRERPRQTAREAIAEAAWRMGGAEGLVEWIRADSKNEYMFWTRIYPRLVPLDINIEVSRVAEVIFKGLNDGSE